MGCSGSKADGGVATPAAHAATPARAAEATTAPVQPTAVLPSGASPFAAASQHATPNDELGHIRSSEWHAADRPAIPAIKGTSQSFRRTSTDSRVGFAVDPEKAPCAERSNSRQSFSLADSVSMQKIVELFYDKVLADPELKHYFDNVSMDRIKLHQARVLNAAFEGKEFGNTEDWSIDLRKTHYHLIRDQGLNQGHWDRFFAHLEETLGGLPTIPLDTRRTALQSIRTTRGYFRPAD